MNVLLTCAGRVAALVRMFQQALGPGGRAIACDSCETAAVFAATEHKIVVPPINHPSYFDTLLEICREERVGLLVSVYDMELESLARQAPRFREQGTIPVIAAPEIVAMCHDKWAAFQWLRSRGIVTPDTYLTAASARAALKAGTLQFPLVVKPRWGSRSIGVEIVENERELALALEWGQIQIRRSILAHLGRGHEQVLIIQQLIEGQEHGIDVVNDLDGNYVTTLARRKLAMRGGNTDRAVTVANAQLDSLGCQLGRHMKHPGPADCDVMVTGQDCYVLDINPRFGGGYPFAHQAGANIPAALLAWARGSAPRQDWLRCRPGVYGSRFEGVVSVDAQNTDGPSDPSENSDSQLVPVI